ncbi:DUF1416 domain-containing protein [Synechococcus sp. Cruz-9H2]|nr:DUF1416 domain-containing protein [Synechococcus sp. Cruz-9H2]MCP9844080.1 DUF1416 domain-containing protein [Synechococcus sp. Edmonson 11F2]MCP9856284.1 DUF1416 domain-containing protein [Synechococcus sp. Cruz-9C9]MCP9863569.1 DUF1416 domain-containing protein [Synechococcus sp. Cruz-7E5]MCP9870765.1 DUF1416 domain-containing protein [Synechococcus sp. Cruz-7B9]
MKKILQLSVTHFISTGLHSLWIGGVIVLFNTPLSAQVVQGQVIKGGRPVRGVPTRILTVDGAETVAGPSYTNSMGLYYFSSVRAGKWKLRIDGPDGVRQQEINVKSPATNIPPIDIENR